MSERVPAAVVVPTIGRLVLLSQCLESVLSCDPLPAEVVIADQSPQRTVESALASSDLGSLVRVVRSEGVGIAKATNDGIAAAAQRTVLVTHDDCTVAPDWIAEGVRLLNRDRGTLLTGRVRAPHGAGYVPSTIEGMQPQDYSGRITSGALYPANMVFDRATMLDFGGFDERPGLRLAAEDNDLCYRWLCDGRPLRYEPSLVVWHHDWRTPEQLVRTHRVYARGQGVFYAKHLAARDRRVLALLRWDLAQHGRALVGAVRHGRARWEDPYREMGGVLLRELLLELWRLRRGGRTRSR